MKRRVESPASEGKLLIVGGGGGDDGSPGGHGKPRDGGLD
jgi:hypothetical protein